MLRGECFLELTSYRVQVMSDVALTTDVVRTSHVIGQPSNRYGQFSYRSKQAINAVFKLSIGMKCFAVGEGEYLSHDHSGYPHQPNCTSCEANSNLVDCQIASSRAANH